MMSAAENSRPRRYSFPASAFSSTPSAASARPPRPRRKWLNNSERGAALAEVVREIGPLLGRAACPPALFQKPSAQHAEKPNDSDAGNPLN